MNKFWNFIRNDAGERILRLEGVICDDDYSAWLSDGVSATDFRRELNSADGDITVRINSEGGDVFAAAAIYTALKEYSGQVTVKIDGIAASAASVVAMAGDSVEISPVAMMMIHNPWTWTQGDSDDMQSAAKLLNEVKETILNAYEQRTKLPRTQLSKMMDEETWLPAQKAVDLHFADKIMFTDEKEIKNMDILDLIDKRAQLWDRAKKYLAENTDKDGKITDAAAAVYDQLNADIAVLSKQIDRYQHQEAFDAYLHRPINKPILTNPSPNPYDYTKKSGGVVGNEYRKNFIQALRKNFNNSAGFLREADDADGGYLLPASFADQLITKLQADNVMRQISKVITTASTHQLPIVASEPTAEIIAEGAEIKLSNPKFGQITMGACKLATGAKISNELLADSYYDLESALADMFAQAIATAEENLFINGNGTSEPQGILTALEARATGFLQTSTGEITADDIINLYYSLNQGYRRRAVWLTSDATVAHLRKLKDSTQNFLWSNSLTDAEPAKLMGAPIYATPFMPAMASGNVPLIFGDFADYFVIGDRGDRIFKPLRELYALSDQSAFLMIGRVDSRLTNPDAFHGLRVR